MSTEITDSATQHNLPPSRGPQPRMRPIVLASVLGSVVECYDFVIYGTAAALVFNTLFFPSLDPLAGTLAAFASYAVGFLVRPLGGIVFGHFGDKIGRRSMLTITMIIMGAGTFLIGCLPTYEQIGILAPIALVLMRIVQGLGVGGEWGGSSARTCATRVRAWPCRSPPPSPVASRRSWRPAFWPVEAAGFRSPSSWSPPRRSPSSRPFGEA